MQNFPQFPKHLHKDFLFFIFYLIGQRFLFFFFPNEHSRLEKFSQFSKVSFSVYYPSLLDLVPELLLKSLSSIFITSVPSLGSCTSFLGLWLQIFNFSLFGLFRLQLILLCKLPNCSSYSLSNYLLVKIHQASSWFTQYNSHACFILTFQAFHKHLILLFSYVYPVP